MSTSKKCHGTELLPLVMYEMVKHSLASKSIKCVVDEDECIFTSDMEVMLSSLSIEHPVGELVYQALKSHKEQFGEGLRTCMFMITRIAKAVSQLEDLGIRSAATLAVIQEVMDELALQVQQICLSIETSSKNEKEIDVKSAHTSLAFPLQSDDSNENTISSSKPLSHVISGGLNKATAMFLRKFCSHSTQVPVKDNLPPISTAGKTNCNNSLNDQPADSKALDSACLCGSTLEENAEHQPLSEWNCLTSDHPVLQTHQRPDSVIKDHLVPGFVMMSDPVMLKMSDLHFKDENEKDDIDWYFNDNFVKDEDEQVLSKSVLNAKLEIEEATSNARVYSNSINSESCFSNEGYQQEDSSHENTLGQNYELKERRHPKLTDNNQHDSDFEDCFDDLENRKQVVVVVERINDLNSNSHTFPLCQDQDTIMKSRMACNIKKHFAPMEFEFVSDVPSLNDSQCDEFSDCFDNAFGSYSQSYSPHTAFHQTYLDRPVAQMNQLGSDLKQEESVMHLKSFERSASESPVRTSEDTETGYISTSPYLSDLQKLNSILSSINMRKSQNVKEILVSSRHKVAETYFTEIDDKNDIKASQNSEKRLFLDSKPDLMEQREISSLKALNHQAKSIAPIESCGLNCETVSSSVRKNDIKLETAVHSAKQPPSSTLSAPVSELEKLNSILSSISVKKTRPQTKQIFLSSRHYLKEDDLIENRPSTPTVSKDLTNFSRKDTSPEVPTSCTKAAADQKQFDDISEGSGCESCMHGRFDLKSVTLPSKESDSCVTAHDVKMRKPGFLELPVDIPYLTRGHEDIIELIERVYSSTTNSATDEGKIRLSPLLTNCISIQSPRSSKAVIEGLVIPCCSNDMENLISKFGCQLNGLLINGDLTPTHRHKGYKPVIAKKNLIKSPCDIASQGKEALWASRIVNQMKKLDVSVIFIRGNTTSIMSDICLSAGIVPLTNTAYHSLRIISHQLKVDMICYAEDASKSDVCEICLEPWNPSWMDRTEESHCLLVSNLNHVRSVVLSEPCALAAQISEEKFWGVFYRVSNAICDGMVLPGGGITELWCVEQIKQMTCNIIDFRKSDEQLLKMTILETLADVFHDFADTVKQNAGVYEKRQEIRLPPYHDATPCNKVACDSCGQCITTGQTEGMGKSNSCDVEMKNRQISDIKAREISVKSNSCYENIDLHFDTFCSKISAWQSAVDVVGVVKSLDCLIITGASEKDLDFNGILL